MEQIVHVGTSKVRLKSRVQINWPRFRAGVTTHINKQITREVMTVFQGSECEVYELQKQRHVLLATLLLAP